MRSWSDRENKNSVTCTATRTSTFYQTWDTKHISLDIFRQKNDYAMFTLNFYFRGAVILTCEGKIVSLIRRYLEHRPASEICHQLQVSSCF